ncbi:hypothetical protein SAMN06265218_101362 [Fodinibius sediminis]|uniref:Uncharacterized protein n=1 Tax=Fodinibius sediminis TaxID=1214077 RepID=A0A521ATH4_9BACT|nr:hypothetical protein SAMN06265218_101362 [Fodinibius sediminis]
MQKALSNFILVWMNEIIRNMLNRKLDCEGKPSPKIEPLA